MKKIIFLLSFLVIFSCSSKFEEKNKLLLPPNFDEMPNLPKKSSKAKAEEIIIEEKGKVKKNSIIKKPETKKQRDQNIEDLKELLLKN